MDMAINGTLIVQGINFIIAYLLLRFLLLKPAIAAIKEHDQEERTLLSMIKSRETALINTEQKAAQEWAEFKDSVAPLIPPVGSEKGIFIDIAPMIEYESPTTQQAQELARKIAPEIIKKVDHVRA